MGSVPMPSLLDSILARRVPAQDTRQSRRQLVSGGSKSHCFTVIMRTLMRPVMSLGRTVLLGSPRKIKRLLYFGMQFVLRGVLEPPSTEKKIGL